MKVTLLGHQSWMITYNKTNVLIDPVLYEGFGSQDDNSIEIYPPRKIEFENIPKIDAIILSHEHSDHFHIPTLLKFKKVPIIVSSIMVNCVLDVLDSFKLTYKITPFYKIISIGELEVILYPADIETALWESRVSQILIRPIKDPQASLFIAVDALVSDRFKKDVNDGLLDLPSVIAVSNNAQITPKGVLGSLDNYKNDKINNRKEIAGLSLLKELLITYLDEIEDIKNIIICGGGFTKKYDTYFGCFPLSEQDKLAEIANYFSIDKKIFGPLPGQTINVKKDDIKYINSVDWVKLDINRLNEINKAGEIFRNHPIKIDIKPIIGESNIKIDQAWFKEQLSKFAKVFILSELGQSAIEFLTLSTSSIPPYGLALKLYHLENNSKLDYFVLNFNKAEFELIDADSVNEDNIPFGIELFLNDFIAILQGKIQIWDLAGIAIKSWYKGDDKLNSPVAFLYGYFGEQVQYKLSYNSLMNRWKNCM